MAQPVQPLRREFRHPGDREKLLPMHRKASKPARTYLAARADSIAPVTWGDSGFT